VPSNATLKSSVEADSPTSPIESAEKQSSDDDDEKKHELRQAQTFLQDTTAFLTALLTKSPKDIWNALTTFVNEAFQLPGAPYQLLLVMPSFLSPDRLYRMLNPFVLGPLANFCAALVSEYMNENFFEFEIKIFPTRCD
jgi:hypothetical protein